MTHPATQDLRIHTLSTGDLERFRTIRLRALRDAPGAFGTRFEDALDWDREVWAELFSSLSVFVAVVDGADAGMVRVAPDREVEGAARLGSLWVAPEARGRGVGGTLVDTVVAWARAAGFAEILLDVSDDNASAVALYERKRFAATGAVDTLPPPRTHLRKHQRRLGLG